jgi:hypothetical protein
LAASTTLRSASSFEGVVARLVDVASKTNMRLARAAQR